MKVGRNKRSIGKNFFFWLHTKHVLLIDTILRCAFLFIVCGCACECSWISVNALLLAQNISVLVTVLAAVCLG